MKTMKQFREFLLRGNLIDLAIAIVVGTAFAAVVKALVADLVTPLIAAIGGKANFANLYFSVHGSRFLYGDLVNVILEVTLETIGADEIIIGRFALPKDLEG